MMTEKPESRAAPPEKPFAENRYNLASCELQRLDDQRAGLISGNLVLQDPWLRLGYSDEGLFRYLSGTDPSLKRYAVVVSGQTTGVVCVRYPWLRGPYLELLAVFPSHQGRGIGRVIVGWMADACLGVSNSIWTTASSFNTRALAFYRNLGFAEIAALPDLVAGGRCEILLRKLLKCP
jgi:diamine N-acetyltransferase